MLGKTNGKTCPGEHKCTTDSENGEIAGVYGRVQKRTLQNYCHGESAGLAGEKLEGCPLFSTKPENTPAMLHGAIDTAEGLRRYKQRGCLPPITELTAWEFCCLDTAEEASEIVEAERMKEATKGSSGNSDTNTTMGKAGDTEKEGGFSNW